MALLKPNTLLNIRESCCGFDAKGKKRKDSTAASVLLYRILALLVVVWSGGGGDSERRRMTTADNRMHSSSLELHHLSSRTQTCICSCWGRKYLAVQETGWAATHTKTDKALPQPPVDLFLSPQEDHDGMHLHRATTEDRQTSKQWIGVALAVGGYAGTSHNPSAGAEKAAMASTRRWISSLDWSCEHNKQATLQAQPKCCASNSQNEQAHNSFLSLFLLGYCFNTGGDI